MKSKSLFFGLFFAFSLAIFPVTSDTAFGQAFNYQPLEQIPGAQMATTSFPQYVQGIYKFGIWTVGLAALFMLSVGGFIYLSSGGNTATIGKAKTYIWDALIGLVLALLAYLILYVINPDLVNVNLGSFSKVGGTVTYTPSQPSGNPIPNFGAATVLPSAGAKVIAGNLKGQANVTLAAAGSCSSSAGPVTPATNIQEVIDGKQMTACHEGCNKAGSAVCNGSATLNESILTQLYALSVYLQAHHPGTGFTVTSIAGGSHGTNSRHYKGTAVDIVPSGMSYSEMKDIFNKKLTITGSYSSTKPFAECDRSGVYPVSCTTGNPNHLHIDLR